MGAEIGATTSLFPYDDHGDAYLRATDREAIADAAWAVRADLACDSGVVVDPRRCFDRVIEIDLSDLVPHINGPHSPDYAHKVSEVGAHARENGWPAQISSALIGSCTNSSYEDITRTASIARQAAGAGLRVKTPLLVTPGSERVRATDEIDGVRLDEPRGETLPQRGFESGTEGFVAPPDDGSVIEVVVDPRSERLQLLEPFPAWDGEDYVDLPVLMKARGKCTTDHISAAGKWLRFRGHLENISGNLFVGAINAFTGEAGSGRCPVHKTTEPYPDAARHCREAGVAWVAVGDENYGEGSSREHAAMEPRFQNGRAVLARSFARIHETNLKKQGMLALTFADPSTYDEIREDDTISVLGLADLAPDKNVQCRITHSDGSTVDFECTHTMSAEHIEWFRAGSALNLIREKYQSAS